MNSTMVTGALATAALAAGALVSTAAAQSPPKHTLVPAMTYTSTPGNGKFSPAVLRGLKVPAGFSISVFAEHLGSPRIIAVRDDGTIYISRRDSGDVIALRDDGTGKAGAPRKVVKSMPGVHGIAFHGGRMYLATVNEIYVADLLPDGGVGRPRAIVTDLPDGGQHGNRTIGFGPDGMMYVSVGSTCNLCNETNEQNATIIRMKPDGTNRGIFARGLRNTIGWGWHPDTHEMWGMDHGSDSKGNDIPPEELNKLESGANYGWPNCYGNRVVDNFYSNQPPGSTKDEVCPRTVAPTLGFTAHSAPIQLAFYTASQFPAEYRGDAFIAMRGSWNREPPSGYKLVRIHFQNGVPVRFDDFATGFIAPDGLTYYARLAGLAVANDGSLLLGDDTNGIIYRITYTGGGSGAAGTGAAARTTTAPSSMMSAASMRRDSLVFGPTTAPKPPRPAERVMYVDSLKEPESVLYDADQDVYLISNIDGPSAAKDGRGFITRVRADGRVEARRWIDSGKNGVTLNAPKGMAIVGDTLWVADVDVMRAFNRRTGAPIASVDLTASGAVFLNDVAVGGDGAVYVSDTEIKPDVHGNNTHPKPDRVIRIDGRRSATVAIQSDRLARPNGMVWDQTNARFVIVPLGGDSVWTWKPGTSTLDLLVTGPGQFDGVAFTSDGTLIVSSKATSSILAFKNGKLEPWIDHLPDVADIAWDGRHGLVGVPLTSENRVDFYKPPQ